MISQNLGFKPKTRVELVELFFERYKNLIGKDDITFLQFQGSNVHLFSNILFDEYEALYSMFIDLYTSQFDFWVTNNLRIEGSNGSSFEGWINRFSSLCKGLDIITSDDPRARAKWTSETEKIAPGEIVIYFDELDDSDKSPLGELHLAFLQCKNIAEPTRHGTETIELFFSNGRKKEYSYNNLKASDYTKIDIKIIVEYDEDGLQYPEVLIKDKITTVFNEKNGINKNIHLGSLFCASGLSGIKDVKILGKLETAGDSDYKTDSIVAELGEKGQKFILNNIVVEQK